MSFSSGAGKRINNISIGKLSRKKTGSMNLLEKNMKSIATMDQLDKKKVDLITTKIT